MKTALAAILLLAAVSTHAQQGQQGQQVVQACPIGTERFSWLEVGSDAEGCVLSTRPADACVDSGFREGLSRYCAEGTHFANWAYSFHDDAGCMRVSMKAECH